MHLPTLVAGFLFLSGAPAALTGAAQEIPRPPKMDTVTAAKETNAPGKSLYLLDGLNVTATRTARPVFATPAPVAVLSAERVRRTAPANLADLFRSVPGLDAEGVGPAQRRPVIRGMRGQRILLLEDGLRLNNVRRRVDSGESTSLVWSSAVERIEVVRGPASVLYGSDALGGVVNLVTRRPGGGEKGVHGFLEAGYRSAGGGRTTGGGVEANLGRLGVRVTGGSRSVGAYRAPAGSFGEVRLEDGTPVFDTGLEDRSVRVSGVYRLPADQEVWLGREVYRSRDSGFGWIDPAIFGPETPRTRLLWPDQRFDRTVFGYRAGSLRGVLADRVELTGFFQSNERSFITEINAPLPGPPGATLNIRSENFTDVDSRGVRMEAQKVTGDGVLLTYGLDVYEDRSAGTDTSTTVISGLGEDRIRGRGGPQIPTARIRNLGVFAQARVDLGPLGEMIAGVRYQDVAARTFATPGNSAEPVRYGDRALVGALNLLARVSPRLNLVGSLSRGFRSPNLVERFFVGATPSGRGFWEPAPELKPETSVNAELGARYRGSRLRGEVFVFQNMLRGGIVLEPTGRKEGRVTYYRNVNVDRLRYRGFEVAGSMSIGANVAVDGNWTVLRVEDERNPERVLAETYPARVGGGIRFDDTSGRFWVHYSLRHNGERNTVEGITPVGSTIPAFTVHDLRGGIRLSGRHELLVGVENLTNALYAEALNTGFFRPEPGRTLVVSARVSF